MQNPLQMQDGAKGIVERPSTFHDFLRALLRGDVKVQHVRDGKVLGEYDFRNGITDEGMNKLLDVMFHAVAAISTWYIGPIDNAGFSALAAGDTMASHAGWSELQAYTQATRPEWTEGDAAARSITNAVTVDFSMNATNVVKGIFITSDNVKGGTTGILWSTAAFGSNVSVQDGDTLKITYTVSG